MNGAVKVCAMNISPLLNDDELFHAAYASVTDERRRKTDNYMFRKDKSLSLGAEILLKETLRRYGAAAPSLEFVYGKENKPFLKERTDIFFNLSHSEEYVMCAVSEKEIGCDIEHVKKMDLEIARRFFNQKEYEDIVLQKTEEEKQDRFFRIWTLKESFIKSTGLGMRLPLDGFTIRIGENSVSIEQSTNRRKYYLAEYFNVPGYKCAVCSESETKENELEITDINKIIERSGAEL